MIEIGTIRDARIFDGLSEAQIEEFAGIGEEWKTPRGERLFRRDDEADAFYVVTAGRFALTLPLREHDDWVEITIEEKSPGEALGWSALVEPHRWMYSAYAERDGAIAAFPRSDLEKMLESDLALAYHFLRNLAQLIGSRIRPLQQLWTDEVEQSMARVSYWTRKHPARWSRA